MSEEEEAPDGPEDLALLDFLAFLCFFFVAFFGVASEVASLEAAGLLLVAPVESVPDAPELGAPMLLEPDVPEVPVVPLVPELPVPLVPDAPELGLPMLLEPDDPEVPLVPELPELIPLLLLLLSVDEPEAPVPLVPELPEVSLEPDEDMPLVPLLPLLPDVPP